MMSSMALRVPNTGTQAPITRRQLIEGRIYSEKGPNYRVYSITVISRIQTGSPQP
jgi:hypothetical protein